jgi:hypothetical protein
MLVACQPASGMVFSDMARKEGLEIGNEPHAAPA